MDCSTPGFPVPHYLLEFAQIHVHWVYQNISSSAALFSFCLQSFPASGSFPRVSSSHQVAKVLELQHQSFQWISRVDFLWDWLVWFVYSPKESQESSPTPQFKSSHSFPLSLLFGPTLTSVHDYWKNQSFDYMDLCVSKVMSLLFNMLSRFVIAFLPRSKRLLISDVT